jgi:protein-S-isoprenylcysteine O-methyltransferase Ste14
MGFGSRMDDGLSLSEPRKGYYPIRGIAFMVDGNFFLKVALMAFAALLTLIAMFFIPAGTFDYWQAWAYIAVIFIPASIILSYFIRKDPEFLERRFRTKEKEAKQRLVVLAGLFVFIAGFLMPGLDQRFGWSSVPAWISIAADAVVFAGYMLVFFVFKENSFAGRTIQVDKGQKVITTGPYSIIRHPMYLGTIAMYIATPLALGSYFAVPPFLLMIPILAYRILNEEDVLRKGLPGYTEYCKKVRYRLIPWVW